MNNPAKVDVTIFLPGPLPAGSTWYKHDSANHTLIDFTANTTITGNKVVLHLIDGGAGDADGIVNGVIIDPGGPVLAPATVGGGGGCALSPSSNKFDPIMPLLALIAMAMLWHRRKKQNEI